MTAFRSLAVSSIAVAIALVGTGLTSGAQAGTLAIRYAAPGGTGTDCSQPAPCDLVTAVNDAPDGATIDIASGSYGSPGAPIVTSLMDNYHALTINGVAGANRPVMYLSAQNGMYLSGATTLSNVAVMYYGSLNGILAVNNGVVIHDVLVEGFNNNVEVCGVVGTITDSECLATGVGSNAIQLVASTSGTATYDVNFRGVTAVAVGSGNSYGMEYIADEGVTFNVAATNSIFEGGRTDVVAKGNTNSSNTAINLSHSEYDSISTSAHHATITAAGTNNNITADPTFVNPGGYDFRERGDSPSVNAGAADPTSDTDLAGNPRVVGTAPDLGAYEYLQGPDLENVALTHIGTKRVSAGLSVNPEGLTTAVTARFTRAGHPAISKTVQAPYSRSLEALTVTTKSLTPNAHYQLSVVVSSAGGNAQTPEIPVTTTVYPFHGIKIGKKSPTLDGSEIPIHLSCPARTVVSCSGKLTLKRAGHGKVGHATIEIAAGKKAVVNPVLNQATMKAIAKSGSVSLTATVVAHDLDNQAKTTHRTLAVKN